MNSRVIYLFDKQDDWIYNQDVWVLLNWEVRQEREDLFTVWRRNLIPDDGRDVGRIKHRADCADLGSAFHYVEMHIKERDKP